MFCWVDVSCQLSQQYHICSLCRYVSCSCLLATHQIQSHSLQMMQVTDEGLLGHCKPGVPISQPTCRCPLSWIAQVLETQYGHQGLLQAADSYSKERQFYSGCAEPNGRLSNHFGRHWCAVGYCTGVEPQVLHGFWLSLSAWPCGAQMHGFPLKSAMTLTGLLSLGVHSLQHNILAQLSIILM